MKTCLYLDDTRPTPEGWDRAYTAPEAIKMIEENSYEFISLDHDLGCCKQCNADAEFGIPTECVHTGNGNDVLLWVEEHAACDREFKIPSVLIHTDNAAAAVRMRKGAASVERFRKLREFKVGNS